MNRNFNQVILSLIMVLAGILLLLRSFDLVNISSGMIFSYLFIVYGFASVYISLGRNLRGRLFMGTALFLTGVILLVVHYYEFPVLRHIIIPSVVFIIGAGFLMLYIDEVENPIFLISSVVLITFSLLYILFARELASFPLTAFLSRILFDFYPLFIILSGVSLLIKGKKRGE